MKLFLCSLIAFAAVSVRAVEFDPAKPPLIKAMKAVKLPPKTEWRLANGITVVFVEDHRIPVVTTLLATPGGEAALPAEDAGLADALGELLTDGTATKTSKQIAEAAELFGGSIVGGAMPDAMFLEASALSDKADAMFSLLSETAREPSFPEAEVALRRANMKEELSADRAQSDFLAKVAFYKKIFAGHPYAVTVPTDASIARVDRARILAAYKKLLTPTGATMVIVGDLTPAQAKSAVESHFGSWKGGPAPADVPAASAAVRERTVFLLDRPKSEQVSYLMGNLAAREDNPAYFDLLVVNGVLGGSFSSRLVRDIREEKGYTYRIGSRLEHRLAASVFRIATPVRNEVAGAALEAVFDHLKRIRETGPTAEELTQAKSYLAGSFARSLETQDGLANLVLHQKLMRLPADFYDRYVERVLAVGVEPAQRAALTFIRPEEMTVIAVGDSTKIHDDVAKFSSRPLVKIGVDGD
jgi:zinc protease